MSQFSNFWSEIMEYDWIFHCFINSSPPSAAYMHQWFGSVLVQIMACYLFVAKPLSKPILGYCQLNHEKQTSVKFWSKYKSFHSSENSCIWKYCPRNGSHFCPGGDELIRKYKNNLPQCWQCFEFKQISFITSQLAIWSHIYVAVC